MGWPLAVSAALMEKQAYALVRALSALSFGHFFSMAIILLPFSVISSIVLVEQQIRLSAGIIVVFFGIYLLIKRRHPRILARIHPSKLAIWSFLAALAHGAGLMLVPIYLGICSAEELDNAHEAAKTLMGDKIGTAIIVAVIHTLAMTLGGGVLAVLMYFWLGLKFLTKTFYNLELVWAFSLVFVGCAGILTAI